MEGCSVYDDSRIPNVLLKNEMIPCSPQVLDSIWVPNSCPSFHAPASMVNFEDIIRDNTSQRQFIEQVDGKVENQTDELDGYCHRPDKKRRLTPNQVQFLEKSFAVENKLEPDRKNQLAKEVGLEPRQVAIWFQNRRARCKTKVLEKEHGSLKASFDKLMADYETLNAENEKLKDEVHLLTKKLLLKEKGQPKTEPCDPISPRDFQPNDHFVSQDDASRVVLVPEAAYKQDDAASSAKSDVFDSDSPRYDASNEDEDDSLRRSLLHFPKVEVECCDDLQPNSCNLGFPVQDQGTWLWQY